jgi:hypothetical protein
LKRRGFLTRGIDSPQTRLAKALLPGRGPGGIKKRIADFEEKAG